MPKLDYKTIFFVLGILLLFNGAFMVFAALAGLYYDDGSALPIALSAAITMVLGGLIIVLTKNRDKSLKQRDGYVIVTFGWIFMVLSGTLPFLFTGTAPDFASAFFETMSGYTTTGATVFSDVESLPKGILLWRSLTHWIGGMGIIVLAVAILPLLGIGGMQLFSAESPGPENEKIKPRIADIAKRLWLIYAGYTISETILLKVAGMGWFDALNHSFATMATGGFSTKNASAAFWNDQPIIQYILIFFMFMAGTNFVLSYYAFKGKVRKFLCNDEFKWYFAFIASFTLVSALLIYFAPGFETAITNHPMVWGKAEASFRHAVFQVISIVTTTGFVTADYTAWTPFLSLFFFGMFFLGGCAGSTAGGVKVIRHLITIRNGIMEFKRALHPNALLPVRYNGKAVERKIVFNILGFFILYILIFIVGSLGYAFLGLDSLTSVGASVTTLGNVGPGFGVLGPVDNFGFLSSVGKWWSAFLMLVGRLELFTVLIILTPFFWRDR